MNDKIIMLFTTFSNSAEAETICQKLVSEKLAFCANILPNTTSIFAWKNQLQKENETLAFIKTFAHLQSQAINRIKELHSYEVPAIIVYSSSDAETHYYNWAQEQVKI